MKLYRLQNYTNEEGSDCFEWFSSYREAISSRAESRRLAREQGKHLLRDEIEEIEFKPTKNGILWLLNRYASHPDNG